MSGNMKLTNQHFIFCKYTETNCLILSSQENPVFEFHATCDIDLVWDKFSLFATGRDVVGLAPQTKLHIQN